MRPGVLLDVGGTLIDTTYPHPVAWRETTLDLAVMLTPSAEERRLHLLHGVLQCPENSPVTAPQWAGKS